MENDIKDMRILNQAFLRAKNKFRATGKSGQQINQGWKYAKIEDIYQAVEDALSAEGIFIRHFCKYIGDDKELLYTLLVHAESGQMAEDERLIRSEKPGNQGRGGAETYAKKQAVLSLCAIPQEDDDCQAEQEHIEEKQRPAIMQELINIVGKNEKLKENIFSYNKVTSFQEMSVDQINKALYAINNPKKKT